MIEDPTGKGHLVKIGMLLGKYSGQRVEHLIALRLPVAQVEAL